MADVKWIKITTDMFDNAKIKYLRSLPEGNNIVLIWVMLLTKAGICNAGGMIFLAENIPYTTAMLANELGFGEDTVKLAITMLSKLGMIQADDVLTITNWDVYQNSEGLEKVREQTRLRVAKHREKQKAICGNATGNATVTPSNATEIDIDIDKDLEEERDTDTEKRKEKNNSTTLTSSMSHLQRDSQECLELWNSLSSLGIATIKDIKPDTVRWKLFAKRMREYGMDDYRTAIENIRESTFLQGVNDNGWTITFDWFIKPNNFAKVLEGNYANRTIVEKPRYKTVEQKNQEFMDMWRNA